MSSTTTISSKGYVWAPTLFRAFLSSAGRAYVGMTTLTSGHAVSARFSSINAILSFKAHSFIVVSVSNDVEAAVRRQAERTEQ